MKRSIFLLFLFHQKRFWVLIDSLFDFETQRPWTRSPNGCSDRSISRCWCVRSTWRSPKRSWISRRVARTCRSVCLPVAAGRCWVDVDAGTIASWNWSLWTSIRKRWRKIAPPTVRRWRSWWRRYASGCAISNNSGSIYLIGCATRVWLCHPATRTNVGTAHT